MSASTRRCLSSASALCCRLDFANAGNPHQQTLCHGAPHTGVRRRYAVRGACGGEMHGVGASDGGICFGLPRRSGRRVAAMPLRSTCVFAGSVAGGEGAVLDRERLKGRCACDVLYLGCPSCVRRGTVSPLQTLSVIPCAVSGDAESGFGHSPCLGHDSGELVRCLHSILRSSPFGHSIWRLVAVICLMSRRAAC